METSNEIKAIKTVGDTNINHELKDSWEIIETKKERKTWEDSSFDEKIYFVLGHRDVEKRKSLLEIEKRRENFKKILKAENNHRG